MCAKALYRHCKKQISDCIEIDDEFRKVLSEKNPEVYQSIIKHDEWKGYGFKLEKVEKLEPIPAKGKLSIWEIDCEGVIIGYQIICGGRNGKKSNYKRCRTIKCFK